MITGGSPDVKTLSINAGVAFAQAGVPVLWTVNGLEILDEPTGTALRKLLEWGKYYHKVSDEIRPDWDLSGVVEDLNLLFAVGYRVAQVDRYPEWKRRSISRGMKFLSDHSLKSSSW